VVGGRGRCSAMLRSERDVAYCLYRAVSGLD
jgi:hypothetical protein